MLAARWMTARRPEGKVLRGVIVIGLAAALGGCRREDDVDAVGRGPIVRQLDTAFATVPRRWRPRFSIDGAARACAAHDAVETARCGDEQASQVVQAGAATKALVAARAPTPAADPLHAAALADLFSGDTSGKVQERSISLIEMATRLQPTAARYTDLAAARLASAGSRGGAKAIVEALDAAGRALELQPRYAPALYDRALAMDQFGLDIGAAKAWRQYLAVDSTSVYASEARERVARLTPPATRPRKPVEVQQWAWDTLLAQWGAATLSRDSAAASRALAEARAAGATLREGGYDNSVSEAVVAIDAARTARREQLARLHAQWGEAQRHAVQDHYVPADSLFASIVTNSGASRPLVARARVAHGNALVYKGKPDSAQPVFEGLLRDREALAGMPLVLARAQWNHGVLLLRNQRPDDGLREAGLAGRYFAQAGDSDAVAGTVGIAGEFLFQAGDAHDAYRITREALLALRRSPATVWRHNNLYVLARAAARSDLLYAARDIEDEDASTARSSARLTSIAEAQLARSRSALLKGNVASAQGPTDSARHIIAQLRDTIARTQLERMIDLNVGTALVRSQPESAVVVLTRVISFFTPLKRQVTLIPAYVARAAAYAAVQRTDAAEQDLRIATAGFEAARSALASASLRSSIKAQARAVTDSLVMLYVRQGKTDRALAALEASRSTRAPGARTAASASHVIVDFALIGGKLLTWTIDAKGSAFRQRNVDRRALQSRIERVRVAMELGGESDAKGDLASLYADLLRGVVERAGVGDLTIIPDHELADVPFAALVDDAGAYLIQGHAVTLAPDLVAAQSTLGVAHVSDAGAALVVADPALDGNVYPTLHSLAGAAEEARAIARLYQAGRTLAGEDADSARVSAALGGGSVVHFAGHAIFDDAQPWQSSLAMKPRGLSANAISKLDLSQVRLVVLSACETMRSASSHADGFAGLGDAFLAAGAKGVIGSLWPVSDRATTQFMLELHRSYATTHGAAAALRSAQVAAIARGESPSVWSAFRYYGTH